jgi:hypothetical protein
LDGFLPLALCKYIVFGGTGFKIKELVSSLDGLYSPGHDGPIVVSKKDMVSNLDLYLSANAMQRLARFRCESFKATSRSNIEQGHRSQLIRRIQINANQSAYEIRSVKEMDNLLRAIRCVHSLFH